MNSPWIIHGSGQCIAQGLSGRNEGNTGESKRMEAGHGLQETDHTIGGGGLNPEPAIIYGHIIWSIYGPYMAIYGPYMAHIWPYMAIYSPYMTIYGPYMSI